MKAPLPDPLDWIDDELTQLDEQGLRRRLQRHDGPQQAVLTIAGRQFVNFGANDYLALAADRRLLEAARRALASDGCGAGASPLVTGRSSPHERLERAIAQFEGTEAALVFSSGYAANVGAIAALADRQDAIYSDAHNHASMIDGCRLSRATVHVYPHGDWRALETLLAETADGYRRRYIITESVFSMHGDLAPLVELAELARQWNAALVVDEAHATGVLGPWGRGLAEALGVESAVHVRIGTLSKALGVSGGFVSGSRSLVDWLVNRARSYIFSTAVPAAVCEAAVAALELVSAEPARRQQVLERAAQLREGLRAGGWDVGASASQIVPVIVDEPLRAVRLSERLQSAGMLVPAMRPPSVPDGRSLLRFSLSAGHTAAMIEMLIAALGSASDA